MTPLIQAIVDRADRGESFAVCLLAKTSGSTPQKAGALMLVGADGRIDGTIGGGCTEAEARTQALAALTRHEQPSSEKGTSEAVVADHWLRFELNQDYGWDDGLVCGGVMHVLIQIIRDSTDAEPWRRALQRLTAGQPAITPLRAVDDNGQTVDLNHECEPTPRLTIAGAGHVGQALAHVARSAGFEITVIDDRADAASEARFPNADRIIAPIDAELRRTALGDNDYVVIVTRGHRHDGQALEAVVRSNARYIGLIGSRRKVIAIYESLMELGVTRDQLGRVHAPIGLRIGAVSPEEIAISIAAELIAIRRGQPPQAAESMRLASRYLDQIADRQTHPA
ncbi:MAG: XdhC/CoxI family protein [Planctomycetota bacterium]